MKIEQRHWQWVGGWDRAADTEFKERASLVFLFGDTRILKDSQLFDEIARTYPQARIVGCSTAGEISGSRVFDHSLVTAALIFDSTRIEHAQIRIQDSEGSFDAGARLSRMLDKQDLSHVLVFSEGLKVNGSELVDGLLSEIPDGVGLTGGLAGDGERFKETVICSNEGPESGKIVAVGFYGDRIKFGYGSQGGFVPFGPKRKVTRADGNVLYELDGQSALEIYKRYLGEERSKDLSTNQFYFPLTYRREGMKVGVVRTILSIDEEKKSMTFAGDISEGGYAQMMKASHERLIDGSHAAASISLETMGKTSQPVFALLISCVGRKIILKQRVEEEIEEVEEVLGSNAELCGFYSYGEIAHFAPFEKCHLHNQTMSITVFYEE